MDINNIRPPVITLPYLGDVYLQLLTINVLSWVETETLDEPYLFLQTFLKEYAKSTDGEHLEIDKLSDKELDEIAEVLCLEIYEQSIESENFPESSKFSYKAEEFQTLLGMCLKMIQKKLIIKPSALKAFHEQQKRIQKMMQPFRAQQTLIGDAMKPFYEQQKRMQKIMQPFRAQQALIGDAMKPFYEQQKRIQKMMQPFRAQQALIGDAMKPFHENQRQMQKMMQPLLMKHIDWGELSVSMQKSSQASAFIHEKNGVLVDDEFISNDEISTALDEITKTQSKQNLTINELITLVQRSTTIRGNLKHYLVTALISLLILMFGQILEATPKQDLKTIQRQAQQIELSQDQKTHLRYVYVKTVLHVRDQGYIKSDVIDYLQPGTVVILIHRTKKWSYISYTDDITNESYNGWVFTRYLKKFN